MTLTSNFRSFRSDAAGVLRSAQAGQLALLRLVFFQALGDAQTLSPVNTGRYRASHQFSRASPNLSQPPEFAGASRQQGVGDPRYARLASEALARAESIFETLRPGNLGSPVFFVSSNLSYSSDIEDGTSAQAPEGVYALTRERALRNFQAEAARLIRP